MKRKNIAIVGSGISGLTAAYLLKDTHDITLFEANSYIGGHTNTITVESHGKTFDVDTGFIVHNDKTYPNFVRLLEELDVAVQPTEMSFSVKDEVNNLEYNGGSLAKMFAQKSNFVKPSFFRMINDIIRFNKHSRLLLEPGNESITLGEYLKDENYSRPFIEQYLLPMGSAIWSTVPQDMLLFPAQNFIRFFLNHGLLDIKDRPQWKTIIGGSKTYVNKMTKSFKERIFLNTGVKAIRRDGRGVQLILNDGVTTKFDEVVIATHSDQALRMLEMPTHAERRILGAIPYQKNTAVLHTDVSLLPKRKLAWASWNYHIAKNTQGRTALTYNMNILQRLDARDVFNVTLNRHDDIHPDKILKVIDYHHPLFTSEGIDAQRHKHIINGVNKTWYCGAYWGNGFHEDGVVSALEVVEGINGKAKRAA